MQGDGPAYGDAIEAGLILAGRDMVSVDLACSRVIGIPPGDIPQYIRFVANGRSQSSIDLVGDPLEHSVKSFRIPDKSPVFHALFRGLYIADIFWSRLSNRPLNHFLYRTGVIGTNPKIIGQKCNLCGDCLTACPEPGVIQLERFRIDYQTCIRCLLCYDVCKQEAIVVKGVSRPQQHPSAGEAVALCEPARTEDLIGRAMDGQPTLRKSISVFFPCLNEEGSVERLTRDLLAILRQEFEQGEVIIVDDGSTDRTGEIADRLAQENDGWVRVIHHKTSRGYGNALKAGFEASRHELVFFTDGDYQFDVKDLRRALPLIDKYDIVVGYRHDRQDPRIRLILSKGYNLLIRMLLGVKLKDIDCSFKLFRRSAVDKIRIDSIGYFVDTEIMVQGTAHGLSIKEIPVRHLPRTSGVSKIRMKHIYTTLHEIAVLWKKVHRGRTSGRSHHENPVG
jgi:ferredoxin